MIFFDEKHITCMLSVEKTDFTIIMHRHVIRSAYERNANHTYHLSILLQNDQKKVYQQDIPNEVLILAFRWNGAFF